MSDYNLRALLIRSEKVEVELANLREIDAQLVKDHEEQSVVIARLRSDTDLLKSDMSEVHGELRILHPLPYARLHLQKCIEDQIASNDAVNAYITRYTMKVIDCVSSLTLALRELKRELKKAWDAHFAATHLCLPPPTLTKVLHVMAERGFTKEVKWCMNLNKATRTCEMLQKVMREVKGKKGMTQLNCFARNGMTSSANRMLSMKGIDVESRSNLGNTPLINAAS